VVNPFGVPAHELDIRHVDAHSHIDKYTAEDIASVLDEIEHHRIFTLAVSVDPTSYQRTLDMTHGCPYIVPSFGIQPWEAPRFVNDLDALVALTKNSPAIGEIGLDHRFITDPGAHLAQTAVFATMLDCAEADHKLVNIHSAGAEQAVLEMVRTRNLENVIVHWYSGPLETLGALLDCGYHVTVGVAVLYDEHIRAIARYVPDDRLLTETDNPGGERFHTGRTGRPDLITQIETAVAYLRDTDTEELRSVVKRNALRLVKRARARPNWM
jgi:TatD DNase family protein